jgi:hypothetical protein
MRSDRLLLPTASLRALAPVVFPASFRGLRLAALPWLCPWENGLGDPAVHVARIRFGGLFGFACGVFGRSPPDQPYL